MERCFGPQLCRRRVSRFGALSTPQLRISGRPIRGSCLTWSWTISTGPSLKCRRVGPNWPDSVADVRVGVTAVRSKICIVLLPLRVTIQRLLGLKRKLKPGPRPIASSRTLVLKTPLERPGSAESKSHKWQEPSMLVVISQRPFGLAIGLFDSNLCPFNTMACDDGSLAARSHKRTVWSALSAMIQRPFSVNATDVMSS